jgi:type IV pilus assembly protein PilY1
MGTGVNGAATLMINAGLSGLPAAPTTQADLNRLCTALVIQYVRGQDLFDEDGDGNRADTRRTVLGDIFHSSPVVVDPPVDKFLCELGVSNQCLRTLYSDELTVPHTPQEPREDLPTSCTVTTPRTRDAYEAYHFINRKRERLILVGANDGMLHAFSDGQGVEDARCDISYPSTAAGGGEERWAFIPSDLLPRLKEMMQGHTYYVDGDIMVRDIWVDLNGDGRKSWNEYRTVAVAAEGRGGTHYFALEMRWEVAGNLAGASQDRPGFRWMFPQPCTDEAARFGKTLLSLSPRPPPIGPVLLETTPERGVQRYDRITAERWVAMLSGGWSPGAEKGRGIYMVDVWSGTVNGRRDNLLWKWEFDEAVTRDADWPRQYMTHGFVAPVSMADYGANDNPRLDGFFDTAVVGDLGGQLWTLRFFEPGQLDDTTKLIRNWSGGRGFVMDRDGVATGTPQSIRSRSPFFYLTTLAVQPDNHALRAFVGTGNRYSLLDRNAGTCRFDNPQACSKLGCEQTQVQYALTRNHAQTLSLENQWGDRQFTDGVYTPWSSRPASLCGSAGEEDFLLAEFPERKVVNCPAPNRGNRISYEFARPRVECGQNTDGLFDCRVRDPGNTINMRDLDINPADTADTLGKNRFFGLWVYGGNEARTFTENPQSSSPNMAKQYDERRLSDTGGVSGWGDLINVTSVTCNARGACSCASGGVCGSPKLLPGPDDIGWFFEYPGLDHKTASGSTVLGSCSLWNSMYLGSASASACGASGNNRARIYQGHYITGAPNCAAGFRTGEAYVRYQERSVMAPPPEPATAIQVSKTGQVKYSTLLVEPGRAQATEVQVSSDMDVLQYVYELPVSESLHMCRHDAAGGAPACLPSEM